jgi:subfamily B ATP-binding cassette protein MsbA
MSVKLTLFVLAVLPIAGLVIGRVGKKLRSGSVQGQHILGSLVSIIEETLFGIRIIKAFNAEEKSIGKFRKNNQYFTNLMKKVERRRVLAHPLSELMGTCVVVMIMYFGGQMILNNEGGMTSQGFIGYLLVFSQVMTPAKSLSTIYYNIQKGMASFDRLKEILLIENPVKDHENAISKSSFDDKIEYNNVWFKYDDVFVLKNIEFTLYKGQTIAIVGPSGAGKSTLVDLLPRFYDAIEGDILIDGISLKNLKQHDIRNLMGIVSQESILFNDTVYNNIAFGDKNVTMEEVIKAAKVANAHDFIVQMDKDYQTNVGDRGIRLSGGQRQRITIARAILMNPPILIMDEATSSLDSESEKMVQNAIFNLMKNRTSIVIAHRLSTIMKADQILVMQDGAIVERGKYQELLDKKGLFKHLHDKQFD